MRTTAFALILALVWPQATAAQQGPPPLKSPYAIEPQRARWGAPVQAKPCPAAPAPVRDLRVEGYYADPLGSVPDRARLLAYREAVAPIFAFSNHVATQADLWAYSSPPSREAAACAMAWLDAWAQGSSLLGAVSTQGGYVRKWTLAGAALAYLKLREAPNLDAVAKRRVEEWLAWQARAVLPEYANAQRRDARNNHAYWAGLAVAASGVAANDRALFDWGVARYRLGIAQIAADGTLPLEMARGARARHYHLFAAAPLVMLAELGAANGLDLYGERDGALRRLVARTVESLEDSSFFDKAAGRPQETVGRLSGATIAWIEPYLARFPDGKAADLVAPLRPARHNWLGGDTSRAFARQ